MYWHELNQKRIAQLRHWLKGKRLIIVGNSIKMLSSEYGELIDSYDVVVRLGKGLPNPNIIKLIGSKTNIWFSGMLRAGIYNRVDCKWKILTPSTSATFDDHNVFIPVNKALFKEDFQPYKHYIWTDSVEETKKYWSAFGFDKDNRPSQGIICCDFFSRRVFHNEIDVIGFDCFSENNIIDGVKHTSWHLPIKTGSANEIPHSVELEKKAMGVLINNYKFRMLPYNN
jgi:hypothetical protein